MNPSKLATWSTVSSRKVPVVDYEVIGIEEERTFGGMEIVVTIRGGSCGDIDIYEKHYEHYEVVDDDGEKEHELVTDGGVDQDDVCSVCGATDTEDETIIVGKPHEGDDRQCTICRSDFLRGETVLSRREADVASHKQITGAPNQKIAERLGLSRSTVDEYHRRMKQKVREAATTVDELDEYL